MRCISSTLALGNTERMAAMAPATWGEAIEVPARPPYLDTGSDDKMSLGLLPPLHGGKLLGLKPPAYPPGARRLTAWDKLEKHETESVLVTELTVIAEEMHAGAPMRFVSPSLPAAIT